MASDSCHNAPAMDESTINRLFNHEPLAPSQERAVNVVRREAHALAMAIFRFCPAGEFRDQAHAHLRQAAAAAAESIRNGSTEKEDL